MRTIYMSKSPEWETPQELFDELNKEFHFDLDVASTHENAKCERHFTEEDDGLAQEWSGTVWCNPPYGRQLKDWVKACGTYEGGQAVMLIPVRADTSWWHEYIWDNPHTKDIRLIRGRVHFNNSPHGAPFASCVIVFDPKRKGMTPRERMRSTM